MVSTQRTSCVVGLLLAASFYVPVHEANGQRSGIVNATFIFDEAPFQQCHASTIVQTRDALVAAWFGGTREKHPDVGIWVSRHEGAGWSPPVEVANGVQHPRKRYPTWNPVLFQPKDGPLLLFYKVGPSPSTWWGMLTTSDDQGRTWSLPRRLPEDILGPVKNKPLVLDDGTIVSGTSVESYQSWACWVERSTDNGRTWSRHGPIEQPGQPFGIIQPAIVSLSANKLRMFVRSRGVGKICYADSADRGRTWSAAKETALPNPNSGIDAVGLRDGRILLIYNHATEGRTPLSLAVSHDGGDTWKRFLDLETTPGEYSYPAIIQTTDGNLHATYTWKRRRIKHVEIEIGDVP